VNIWPSCTSAGIHRVCREKRNKSTVVALHRSVSCDACTRYTLDDWGLVRCASSVGAQLAARLSTSFCESHRPSSRLVRATLKLKLHKRRQSETVGPSCAGDLCMMEKLSTLKRREEKTCKAIPETW